MTRYWQNLFVCQRSIQIKVSVTELFLRGIKLNISLVFISQSYFKVPRTIRLNLAHYFIMKIPHKKDSNKYCRIIFFLYNVDNQKLRKYKIKNIQPPDSK